eukprot:4760009-Pyramimonas_sp.AAC.1
MEFDWARHRDYMKGIHTPVRFIFWSFNDIVDGHGDLIGIGSGTQRPEDPFAFAGSLRILVERAIKLVGDAVSRAGDGAIEI